VRDVAGQRDRFVASPEGLIRIPKKPQFPEKARYDGVGDPRDAANWTCPPRDRSLLEVGPNGIQAGLNPRERHK
jgi:hypothetical protein